MARLGSKDGLQPFRTPRDYADFLARINNYVDLTESTIGVLKRGIPSGRVLLKKDVSRVIRQLQSFLVDDLIQSTFYGPTASMHDGFIPDS